jgi:hypothetical protein
MAETSTTTYMQLVLPTPGERLGPTWASDINTALTSIDSHDHSSNKGAQIGIAGITIDGAFDFEKSTTSYAATNMKFLNLKKENSPSTAFPPASTTYWTSLIAGGTGGDLYWNNANNQQVQITSGGVVNVTGVSINTIALQAGAISTSTYTIVEGNNKSIYACNLGGPIAITLPTIGSSPTTSSDGRMFVIKDLSGLAGTHNITIHRASTNTIDGAITNVISSNYGSVTLVADETSATWLII